MNAEEIVSRYPFWIIVRRGAAFWIDLALIGLLPLNARIFLGEEFYAQATGLWFTLGIAYFPVLEAVFGFTIGKRILGLAVVDLEGKPPRPGQAIVRALLRLFELNPVLGGGAAGGAIALFSKKKQRLGDMLAKTYVVMRKDVAGGGTGF